MIEVVVCGAFGRLGARIAHAVLGASGLRLHAALVRPGSKHEGQPVGAAGRELAGDLIASSDLAGALGPGRVLIETVANPEHALDHARLAAAKRCPVLVATTGFSTKQRESLFGLGSEVPIILAPNLSLGVTVLTELVRQASKALAGYDLEIVELHHRKKRDAPSGTAWALARAASEARGRDADQDAILARSGDIGPRSDTEIGLQTLRGGEVVGEHTVFFFGPHERLELTHRAQSREAFAEGAVSAARFLGAAGRAPGVYTMLDVVGLTSR